jgi:hypothetical protein
VVVRWWSKGGLLMVHGGSLVVRRWLADSLGWFGDGSRMARQWSGVA